MYDILTLNPSKCAVEVFSQRLYENHCFRFSVRLQNISCLVGESTETTLQFSVISINEIYQASHVTKDIKNQMHNIIVMFQ